MSLRARRKMLTKNNITIARSADIFTDIANFTPKLSHQWLYGKEVEKNMREAIKQKELMSPHSFRPQQNERGQFYAARPVAITG
ncbi:hypothetical protein RRG08_042789 [Elysia crispata]|uniref:Uncharacterized protein n=1 Tax=Elysia crispata TaxID=231223 RepID=A0AAE0XNE3_9GAST|nr:hypothetical protein RRG08_042789 [Elysia crispata]